MICRLKWYKSYLEYAVFALLTLCIIYLITASATSHLTAEAAQALTPTFSHPGGYYEHTIRLTLTAMRSGGHVLFTTDGSVPTSTSGTLYTRPILLDVATPGVVVIRARVIFPDQRLGPIVSTSYFLDLPATLPLLSLIIDPDDLWEPNHGIYATPRMRGIDWERPASVTYIDKDRDSGFTVQAGVRIHGHQSRDFDKKSFRLYFRTAYGPTRLEYPLFATSSVTSFNCLVIHSGGQDWAYPPLSNWTLLRNQLAAQLAFDVGGYAAHSQPTLLFINGEPWGIYHIRERVDEDFLADHYDLTATDFLDSPDSFLRQTLMGDRSHWDYLLHFVETHDIADAANYAYVQSQVDIANFIDYHILQIYAANTDWPAHNVYQIRPRTPGGRWQWIFWDSDNGFVADSYSQLESDMVSHLLDYRHPETDRRDTLLFRALLQSPAFTERFVARAADLLHTTLAPAAVVAHIDAFAAELRPDLAYETSRWPTTSDWETHIQELRNFAHQRPALVRQHIATRLELSGVVELAFEPPVGGLGTIAINGDIVSQLPWQGFFFEGVPVIITALPAPGYRFAGWSPASLPQTSTLTLAPEIAQTLVARFVRVDKNHIQPGDVAIAAVDDDGGWFDLYVQHRGGVDLRGWRITDNDSLSATDEGVLIFGTHPALTHIPRGTTIRVNITPNTTANAVPPDDIANWDHRLVFHTGNAILDATTDPGFSIGPVDNLVLLAPGHAPTQPNGYVIAFWSSSPAVTPASFGILTAEVQERGVRKQDHLILNP